MEWLQGNQIFGIFIKQLVYATGINVCFLHWHVTKDSKIMEEIFPHCNWEYGYLNETVHPEKNDLWNSKTFTSNVSMPT
jgi:hypothetical protein